MCVSDVGGESLAAKKLEANPTDAYSQNYYSKVQAGLLPQKTSAVSHREQTKVKNKVINGAKKKNALEMIMFG